MNAAQGSFALSAGSPAIDSAAPGLPYDEDGTSADMGWRAGRYANGVEFYVSKDGNDTTGTGSLATPFLTINKAVSVAGNGSWILVGPGTYAESVLYSGKTLGIKALGGPLATTIQGGSSNAVVTIDAAAVNARLQGFRITGGIGRPVASSYGFDYYGGGLHCTTAVAFVSDCVFEGNGKGTPRVNSATFGGAIYSAGGKLTVTNCLLNGNYAWASGGATLTEGGTIEFDRCTVYGNDATVFFGQQGGLSVANNGKMVLKNSIVYGNTGTQIGAFGAPYNAGTSITVEYSDVQGTLSGGGAATFAGGTGNLSADPLFTNATTKDFSLKTGSPAMDKGNPAATKDVDGTRADMGWRADRYVLSSAVGRPAVIATTQTPLNGSKVLLPVDDNVVVITGTVTHERGVAALVFERTLAGVKAVMDADVFEDAPVLVNGRMMRHWTWTVELPFEIFGKCDYSVFAMDENNVRSTTLLGSFTAAAAAHVEVINGITDGGSVTVTPALPANGLVEVGTVLQITASAKTGYLFRLLEVDVQGLPESDISRNTLSLSVTADTVITPQFIVNPFPALAGQWTGNCSTNNNGGDAYVSLTINKTGAFSIRVTQGRNAFGYKGFMDASGIARISIPGNFYPYASGSSNNNYLYGSSTYPAYCTLSLVNGINFNFGDQAGSGLYGTSPLSKAASPTVVATLASKRFNASLASGDYYYNAVAAPGFASYDIGSSGVVLSSGMVNVTPSNSNSSLPLKTVRYTFSSPLVMESVYVSSGSFKSVPAVNFTSIGAPSDIGLIGHLNLNESSLTGSFIASQFVTGPLDPNYGSNSYNGNYYSSFDLLGYAYIAPKVGQAPLPFMLSGPTSFAASMGDLSMGTLSLVNLRPLFRSTPGTVSASQGLSLRSAALSALTTNGAISGSVVTVGTASGSPVKSRTFSGVLLQGGSQAGTALTTDGLQINFR